MTIALLYGMNTRTSGRRRTSVRTFARATAATLALALTIDAASASAGQRIVNGLETQAYPTTGALLHHGGGPITSANASAWCTGTLIGCHTFLTAAHCAGDLVANHYWVYLQHGGIYAVSSVTTNPAYDGSSGNDIAIITLASDVVGIAPTPINTTHDLAALGTGYAGIVAGFGQTSGSGNDYGIKRYGAVTTANCDTVATGGEGNDRLVCWDFTNPLGPPATDSNTCNGDSGGPLFINFGSGDEVVGATSAGISATCLPADHSWDANVYFNAAFIQSQMAGDSTSSCGAVLPLTDPSATVLADSGTLSSANIDDTYTVTVTGAPALARFTVNGKDNGSFHTAFYVKQGAGPASAASYDCKSDGGANYAGCEFANPVAGPWSVTVARFTGTGNYQMTTTLLEAAASECGNGVAEGAEACDGADLGSCVAGPCNLDCTCPAPVCGN
ncbi:MAG: trypsin-like serine protease, partial [Deltaproteobacteria bacterium]|nr:trypsin-like serine protease [Deltaproteobacteria bacterium]